jgi:general secretion pathway protein M
MTAQISAWRESLRSWWQARAPRERVMLAAGAIVLALGLGFTLMQSVERSRASLRIAVPALRAQAALLEQRAAEFARWRAAPRATASPGDLRTLLQAQAAAAGLGRVLTGLEAVDAAQVKVVFGAVAFADWLEWVAGLEAQQVRVEACRIEALATPGLVNVTATLVRPQAQQ